MFDDVELIVDELVGVAVEEVLLVDDDVLVEVLVTLIVCDGLCVGLDVDVAVDV